MNERCTLFSKAISGRSVKYIPYNTVLDCHNTDLETSVMQGRCDIVEMLSDHETDAQDFGKRYVSVSDVIGDTMHVLCAAFQHAPNRDIGRAIALLEAVLYSVEKLEELEHFTQRSSFLEVMKNQIESLSLSPEEKHAWIQRLDEMHVELDR